MENTMNLFQFEFKPVEEIVPWGREGDLSLSLFALTDGLFRMPVGDQVLFTYSNDIIAHWGLDSPDADHFIVAFARDILGAAAAGMAPLSPRVERLVQDRETLALLERVSETEEFEEEDIPYMAWRWLGERSPWTSYLNANPRFQFVRVQQHVQISWDNRGCEVDGIPVWTAGQGIYQLPLLDFRQHCQDFTEQLLSAMAERIRALEAGQAMAQIPVDTQDLWRQHATWSDEFRSLAEYQPDFTWQETEQAIAVIAARAGVEF